MKVIYYSPSFFADCDFPLIKELQGKGIDVRYYMPLDFNFQKSSIIEFSRPCRRWGIYKASQFEDMHVYSECVDLERLYFICGNINKWWWPLSLVLWILVYFHMLKQKADAINITWQLGGYEKILMKLPFKGKCYMTVHDPAQHSNTYGFEQEEKKRIEIFNWADRFMLLNNTQVEMFSKSYSIDKNRITVSGLGAYNSILHLNICNKTCYKKPYIIFFGQILPHKGIEYLLEAMIDVHKECPDIDLIIAGGGRLYFDYSAYKGLDYVKLLNYYIGVQELVGLVGNALFTVCPYKDATQSGVVQTSLVLGTPVIATSVGTLPEIINDGKYGCVVPPCSYMHLYKAIVYLINNPEILDEMKTNIKEKWLPSMSWAPIADKYIELYNS